MGHCSVFLLQQKLRMMPVEQLNKSHGNASWVPVPLVSPQTPGILQRLLYERRVLGMLWFRAMKYHPGLTVLSSVFLPALLLSSIRLSRLTRRKHGDAAELLGSPGRRGLSPYHLERAQVFFTAWDTLALACFILTLFNIRWETAEGIWFHGVFACLEGLLHWFVLETPIHAVFTLFYKPSTVQRAASCGRATAILNYNLLATRKDDVDECMEQMFAAYAGSWGDLPIAAVLVSATNDADLKEYELMKRDEMRSRITDLALRRWPEVSDGARILAEDTPSTIVNDFMVVHRVSRVLRKCGQYQDLMALCAGYDTAFTYCSEELHGKAARKRGEPLFHPSPDVDNLRGRHFDYTIVLDADTGLQPGALADAIKVGEAYPHVDIIQPAMRFTVAPEDSVYAHLEAIRQVIFGPMTRVQTSFFNKSPFFGKGIIRSSAYMSRVIGTPDNPLDVVPVDVLSHDTFEAAVTTTLYVPDAFMDEAPCSNYASWSEREMRWNRGELILATYFWPKTFGSLVRGLQRLSGKDVVCTKTEHVTKTLAQLDVVSLYFGHGALRTMSMKIVLLVYLVFAGFVDTWWPRLPLMIVLFSIIVLPKIAVWDASSPLVMMLETLTSVTQFTTEAGIGSARVIRAFVGLARGVSTWTPQAAVEAEFHSSNPWMHAMRYLWVFSLFALIAIVFFVAVPQAGSYELLFHLTVVLLLPLHVGFTSQRVADCPGPLARLLRWGACGASG